MDSIYEEVIREAIYAADNKAKRNNAEKSYYTQKQQHYDTQQYSSPSISLAHIQLECSFILSQKGVSHQIQLAHEEFLEYMSGLLKAPSANSIEWLAAARKAIKKIKSIHQESAKLQHNTSYPAVETLNNTRNTQYNSSFRDPKQTFVDTKVSFGDTHMSPLHTDYSNRSQQFNTRGKQLISSMHENLNLIEENVDKLGLTHDNSRILLTEPIYNENRRKIDKNEYMNRYQNDLNTTNNSTIEKNHSYLNNSYNNNTLPNYNTSNTHLNHTHNTTKFNHSSSSQSVFANRFGGELETLTKTQPVQDIDDISRISYYYKTNNNNNNINNNNTYNPNLNQTQQFEESFNERYSSTNNAMRPQDHITTEYSNNQTTILKDEINNLDFEQVEQNIKKLNSCFMRWIAFTKKSQLKRTQRQKIRSIELQATKLRNHSIIEKSFCLLRGFALVSAHKRRNYDSIRSRYEIQLQRNCFEYLRQVVHENRQNTKKIEWMIQRREQINKQSMFSFWKYRGKILKQRRVIASKTIYPSIIDDNLVSKCYQADMVSWINAPLLAKQQQAALSTLTQKAFSVLKQLLIKNRSAGQLRQYKLLAVSFDALRLQAQIRQNLKQKLELFVAKKLYSQLSGILNEWKTVSSNNQSIRLKGQSIFSNYRRRVLTEKITQWIQLFNICQDQKEQETKAKIHFFKVVCSKAILSLRRNRLECKRDSIQLAMSKSHQIKHLLSSVMNSWKILSIDRSIQRRKAKTVEQLVGMNRKLNSLRIWRLQLSYLSLVKHHRTARAFMQFKRALEIEQDDSVQQNRLAIEFQEKLTARRAINAFHLLAAHTQRTADSIRTAFMFQYNTLLRKGFFGFQQLIQLNRLKEIQAIQHLRQTHSQVLLKILYGWHQRARINAPMRQKSKLAVNFYIKKLFQSFTRILTQNAITSKTNRQNKDLSKLFFKNSIWRRWRQQFVLKLVAKHNSKRLLTLGFKGLSIYLAYKRNIHEKEQKADSFYGVRIYKTLQQSMDAFKANREKAYLVKYLLNQVQTILFRKKKQRIFKALTVITKQSKKTNFKINKLQKKKSKLLFKAVFDGWREIVQNNKLAATKIGNIIRQQIRTEQKDALNIWRNVIDSMATEKELHNKGIFLRDALLKRRLFASLRQNNFNAKEERAKQQAAIAFRQSHLFHLFMGLFYEAIAQKKLKMIAARHFATSLQKKTIKAWICFSNSLLEERYHKIDLPRFDTTTTSTGKILSDVVGKENQGLRLLKDHKKKQQEQQQTMKSGNNNTDYNLKNSLIVNRSSFFGSQLLN